MASFWTLSIRSKAFVIAYIATPLLEAKKLRHAFILASATGKKYAQVEEGNRMRRQNVTGRGIAYVRSEQNLSQETLAARLQCDGLDLSRQMLANIESGRKRVEDDMLPYFQRALCVPIVRFFSQAVRDDDAKFAAGAVAGSPRTPLKKCRKLTKKRPPV